jgi:glyoxylase-like metal-dependent hydrolase (beta-lactamase superfamily II)
VTGAAPSGDVAGPPLAGMVALRPDLVWLRHREAQVEALGLSTNAYAVLGPRGAVLVDAVFADTVPDAAAVAAWGVPPVALVLTHRHLVPQADDLDGIARRLRVPIFLHPADAAHPQAGRGRVYHDPTDSAVIAAAGVEVVPFPGHTEGHVALYLAAEGGALLAGDAAMSVPDPRSPSASPGPPTRSTPRPGRPARRRTSPRRPTRSGPRSATRTP